MAALTLMPLLRQAAIRSLQTATFSCRFSVCKLFSITVSPVSDSIFQSPRLHDTIRYYGDIFSHQRKCLIITHLQNYGGPS